MAVKMLSPTILGTGRRGDRETETERHRDIERQRRTDRPRDRQAPGSTSVVRWSSVLPDDLAADAALRARQRGARSALLAGEDALLPPAALCGTQLAMESCGAPSDRSAHMRATVQRKPLTPATALIESAEFAIAAVVSAPLTPTDDTAPRQAKHTGLAVRGSSPGRQPAAEPQPVSQPDKKSRRSTARTKATRRAQQSGAPRLTVRTTKLATDGQTEASAAATRWPQRSAGSKALGAGPAPLTGAGPNFSALPDIAGDRSPPASQLERHEENAAKEITRSGACVRDKDGAPSAR